VDRIGLTAAILVLFSGATPAWTVASAGGGAADPELALQFDFFDVRDGVVPDGSGHRHDGRLVGGTIVSGKRKPAVQLAGAGVVTSESLASDTELAGRALTVGAMCKASAPDGVLVSMGDTMDGFKLYLKGGVPRFAVRARGVLREAVADEPIELEQWVHIAGVIGEEGRLAVLVNAWAVGQTEALSFLARTPAGPFAVGAGGNGPGGDSAGRWQGLIEDVRLYRGAISRQAHRELLGDWANRPGCGCRK
jgi:hypothetical protein